MYSLFTPEQTDAVCITGLCRAPRFKSDITVLVLSYCDSIKSIIIYDANSLTVF